MLRAVTKIDYKSWASQRRDTEYADLLSGKRAVLVGPAGHMVGSGRGLEIDGFDLVVRMNKALSQPMPADDFGVRCDILYHCEVETEDTGGPVDANLWHNRGVRVVATPHNRSRVFSTWSKITQPFADKVIRGRFPLHIPDNEVYQNLQSLVCHPNVGTAAIVDLLHHGVPHLHVMGVTFMQGGYAPSYRRLDEDQAWAWVGKWTQHDPERQRAFIAKLARQSERLMFDKEGLLALSQRSKARHGSSTKSRLERHMIQSLS